MDASPVFARSLALSISLAGLAAAKAEESPQRESPLSPPTYTASEREHWAYQPVRAAAPPRLSAAGRAWARAPLDAFVWRLLERHQLAPAAEAPAAQLVRRVYFDLTGLPPTPEQARAFLQDSRPDAYERLVDRLLASPRYGEHWGAQWLDVARYAESEGFEYDRHRPGAWRYRDYVIASGNRDLPYDQFVIEQLAGDELTASRDEASIDETPHSAEPHSAELHSAELYEGAAGGPDPQAAAAQVAVGFHRLGPVRRNAGNSDVAFSRNEVLTEMTDAVGAVFLGLTVACARCHDHMFDAIRQQDYYQLQAFLAATQEHDVLLADAQTAARWRRRKEQVEGEVKRIREAMQDAVGAERDQLAAALQKVQERTPPPLPTISSARNDPQLENRVRILRRGLTSQPGPLVAPRVLGVLGGLGGAAPAGGPAPARPKLALARWIADPRHPLTARVIVNRIWQQHFGIGLVATPNDFGVAGDPPSHPELLDYLAAELVTHHWRLKPLHRMLVTSSAYRQASSSPQAEAARRADPANRWLWRHSRRRLAGEELRDSLLAISGRLNSRLGGPSVIPPVEQELVNLLYKPEQWEVTANPVEHDRRSVYLIAKRNLRIPFLELFDQPDRQTSCPTRQATTHAPQALELLNSPEVRRWAASLAARLSREAGGDPPAIVRRAFWLAASRDPSAAELRLSLQFLQENSLEEFARAVLNLNALLYVD